MNILEELFPEDPSYKGQWQTVYLEPIIGSGESIAIVVSVVGENSEYKVIQAIRDELLDCLYGVQASNMQNMIDWVIESINKEFKNSSNLLNWIPPFDGVRVGKAHNAADENIDGILQQAVRFSASLSALALDAEREEDEPQPKKYTEQWTKSIADELKCINPRLSAFFKQKIKISETNIMTTYGFLTEKHVSNFELLVPTRLSSSLSGVKAKLFDLETLQKSNILIKPKIYEIVIGAPSLNDPTLSDNAVKRLRDTIELVTEVAATENIKIYRAENARQVAEHLNEVA